MDPASQVQFVDDGVYILFPTNVFVNGIYTSLHGPKLYG